MKNSYKRLPEIRRSLKATIEMRFEALRMLVALHKIVPPTREELNEIESCLNELERDFKLREMTDYYIAMPTLIVV